MTATRAMWRARLERLTRPLGDLAVLAHDRALAPTLAWLRQPESWGKMTGAAVVASVVCGIGYAIVLTVRATDRAEAEALYRRRVLTVEEVAALRAESPCLAEYVPRHLAARPSTPLVGEDAYATRKICADHELAQRQAAAMAAQ